MKKYLKLLRVKHYLKNFLVFLPPFFAGNLLEINILMLSVMAFIAFSLVSSIVYIFNDIIDIEQDRLHEVKKSRPIASGEISKSKALITMIILIIVSGVIIFLISIQTNYLTLVPILAYILLNIIYSKGGKHIPILDIIILTSGFVFRIYFGGLATDVAVSDYLALTTFSSALFMALGKRRNEFENSTQTRKVLQYYSKEFLDKFMYVALSLSIFFYSLWTLTGNQKFTITIPFVIIFFMGYSLLVESDEFGDPVDVILKNKFILLIGIAMGGVVFLILYLSQILDWLKIL